MLIVNSIRLTENMVTFIKKRMSLCGTIIEDECTVWRMFGVRDVLDDRNPMRVPVQTVQGHIRSSSPNTSCEVLPLPSVYGLSVEVQGLAAHETGLFVVGMVDGGKIVEEVYPIKGIHLEPIHRIHGCRVGRARELWSREASCPIIISTPGRPGILPSWLQ